MNIAQIWKDDYPWDVRVEKTCKALIDDGHKVHLICRNIGKDKIRDEIDGIQIHRLYPFKNSLLNNLYSIVAFFNPVWIRKICQVAKQEKIDILLVRDLPLVISALIVGKIFTIPVIFDMAENYPSMWKEHVDRRGAKFINHLLKNPTIATLMENYVIKKVDHIIVVVEESKDRLMKKGVSGKKISIVSNTPDLAIFNKPLLDTEEKFPGKFKMLYVGYVNGGRGLDTVIKAIPLIMEQLPDFHLVIAGDGEYLDDLKNMSLELGVGEHVSFLGWIDSKLVPAYIYSSDVCVVPHDATEFVNTTVPNKIFDYMACRKPIIVSNAAPLERIVKETDCGLVFNSRDVRDFADKVLVLQDPSIREKKGENGFEAIKSKYNWTRDAQILKNIFKNNPPSVNQSPRPVAHPL